MKARNIFEAVAVDQKVKEKTDLELATLVEEHLWAVSAIGTPQEAILCSVIDRLRRANGGPCPHTYNAAGKVLEDEG